MRYAAWNHSLSLTIGPPRSTLVSQMLLTTSGVRSPASSRSWLRLSPCSPLFEKLPKVDPLNELPPSFGMMFTRTPPMATSAETAPIS